MTARLLAALLLAPALAGCLGAEAPAALVTGLPRVGDVVEYEVAGPYLDLVRWEPEVPPQLTRLRLTVSDGPELHDAALRPRDTVAVALDAHVAGAWQTLDIRHVDRATNAVAQVLTPFNETERVVSWEELGAPWLFGASALMGRTIAGDLELAVPASAGQPAALPLPFRLAREGDAWRVTAASGVLLEYTWRDGATYPETFRISLGATSAGHAAGAFERGAAFEGRKVAETRGAGEPATRPGAHAPPPPVAEPAPFDGRIPPETGDGLAFPLAEAVAAAERQDPGLRAFLDAHPQNRLHRATYFLAPAQAAGLPPEPTWNLGYVAVDETYYEVKVARAAGLALHRTYDSGPVEPPRGEHGWIPDDALPDRLLPLDDAVRSFQEFFDEDEYEIFVRSFAGDPRTPPGYYYLIDGGYREPAGRYTTTWNAQTGLLESAVGPVEPR